VELAEVSQIARSAIAICNAHVAFRRRWSSPARTPYLIYTGVVTAGGNSALLSSRESLQETHLKNVLVPDANGSSAAARARHAENYPSPRDERKLFNRVSCSGRWRLVSLLLFPACSLRAFYFRLFVPVARPTGTNQRLWRNFDDLDREIVTESSIEQIDLLVFLQTWNALRKCCATCLSPNVQNTW